MGDGAVIHWPKMLYRPGSMLVWEGLDLDYRIVADEAEERAAIAEGWSVSPHSKAAHPLDHDGDGRRGGSIAPPADDDLPALRAEYQDKMGKRAFPGWSAAEIRKRMA